jgi:hypothetical protein
MGIVFPENPDEYEPEVGTILPRLKTAHSVPDIRQIIREEFLRWFITDLDRDKVRLDGMTCEIWDAWCRYTQ